MCVCDLFLFEYKGERRSAAIEAAAAREVREAMSAALAAVQQRQNDEAIESTRGALTEVAQTVDLQAAEISALQAAAAQLDGRIAEERYARAAEIESEAAARAAADDEAQVSSLYM